MKNLSNYLTEQLNEGRKDTYLNIGSNENGDNLFMIYDVKGNLIEFDTNAVEKLRKKYGVYDDEFIKAVFDMFPEADQLSIEFGRNNDENEQGEYVLRDEMKDGWQEA